MRALIQRVSQATVWNNGKRLSCIGKGLLIFVGIGTDDEEQDIGYLCRKIVQLRVFDDAGGIMNLPLSDVNGELLVVSQFTLHASTKKGNRPSYIRAARPEIAIPLYERFCHELAQLSGRAVQTGEFGADMQVEMINDGPVTIWIDSKNRE
ncbi:MAG: D-aminoacyl-tRNA deacylase [bacterium]|nr:D-aminoacyl-tRNA deacylase [bacterium]MDD3624652.1 D-aminoacyl-tRNA deacylase [Proteiniphilum sp.]MDD3967761.1 D-aminoacyl-tRNA deacylase [Proteiniphilum sp.]